MGITLFRSIFLACLARAFLGFLAAASILELVVVLQLASRYPGLAPREVLELGGFVIYRMLPDAVLLGTCVGAGWTAAALSDEGFWWTLMGQGVRPVRLLAPFGLLACASAALLQPVVHEAVPRAHYLKDILLHLPPAQADRLFEQLLDGTFRLPHTAVRRLGVAADREGSRRFAMFRDSGRGEAHLIVAEAARLEGDPGSMLRLWVFERGQAVQFRPEEPGSARELGFERLEIGLDLGRLLKDEGTPEIDELPSPELAARLHEGPDPEAASVLGLRWAMVLAPFGLVLAAVAAAVASAGRSLPARVGAVLLPAPAALQAALRLAEDGAAAGGLAWWAAAAIPSGLLALVGLVLYFRLVGPPRKI